MRIRSLITLILGLLLAALGALIIIRGEVMPGLIPLVIGLSLSFLGFSKSRAANLIFGHAVIVAGCYLVTWGIYLLPYSEPDLSHIFWYPLFWGLFSIMGGICALFHGFCKCVIRSAEEK